jgi:hypothetical protein
MASLRPAIMKEPRYSVCVSGLQEVYYNLQHSSIGLLDDLQCFILQEEEEEIYLSQSANKRR